MSTHGQHLCQLHSHTPATTPTRFSATLIAAPSPPPPAAAALPARTLTAVGLAAAMKQKRVAPRRVGQLGSGPSCSGSTNVTLLPAGVNRLNASISCCTPLTGQPATMMLRACVCRGAWCVCVCVQASA
jgi:hypothetical protein